MSTSEGKPWLSRVGSAKPRYLICYLAPTSTRTISLKTAIVCNVVTMTWAHEGSRRNEPTG